jgi:hypothetical protein
LLTQWLAKYGYLPIVLIGMAGLALEIGTGEWKSGEFDAGDIARSSPSGLVLPVERHPTASPLEP